MTARADLERIAAMEAEVWQEDRSYLPDALGAELAADPSGTTVVVAEADDGTVVCAGWVRYVARHRVRHPVGRVDPGARGDGAACYGAVVRYRARLAVDRGFSYLQVDASDDSRPILERAGFVAVTTTTPYVHTP